VGVCGVRVYTCTAAKRLNWWNWFYCPREGCEVLWSSSLHVCLSACIKNTSKCYEIFYTCYIQPWLRYLLTTMQYVMYFWFCWWRHFYDVYVVYGEAYGRGMSVSGRQHREERSWSASAPFLSALPPADWHPSALSLAGGDVCYTRLHVCLSACITAATLDCLVVMTVTTARGRLLYIKWGPPTARRHLRQLCWTLKIFALAANYKRRGLEVQRQLGELWIEISFWICTQRVPRNTVLMGVWILNGKSDLPREQYIYDTASSGSVISALASWILVYLHYNCYSA